MGLAEKKRQANEMMDAGDHDAKKIAAATGLPLATVSGMLGHRGMVKSLSKAAATPTPAPAQTATQAPTPAPTPAPATLATTTPAKPTPAPTPPDSPPAAETTFIDTRSSPTAPAHDQVYEVVRQEEGGETRQLLIPVQGVGAKGRGTVQLTAITLSYYDRANADYLEKMRSQVVDPNQMPDEYPGGIPAFIEDCIVLYYERVLQKKLAWIDTGPRSPSGGLR